MSAVVRASPLSFPFACESPFLFAVYHLDRYPNGNADLGPDASLAGHRIGADFGHASGWNMYHGESIPGFPKHPHRGFETITVTRRGYVDHTDSLGNSGRFGGGDVQWMTAGSGISHAEMFPLLNRTEENVLELFQIWINLPKATKMSPPSFKMMWAEELPRTSSQGVEATLIAGSFAGLPQPPPPPQHSYAATETADVLVMAIKLDKGATFTIPGYAGLRSAESLNRNLYFFGGSGVAKVSDKECRSHCKLKLRSEVDATLSALEGEVELLLLQGRDIGEPVVQHGPFVGNTQQDIMKAFSDYQRDEFGGWPWPSDALAFGRDRSRFAKYADGKLEERPIGTLK